MCAHYRCGWRGHSFISLIEESNGGSNANESNLIPGSVVYTTVEVSKYHYSDKAKGIRLQMAELRAYQ